VFLFDVMDANSLLLSAGRDAASALYKYRLALPGTKKGRGMLLTRLAAKPQNIFVSRRRYACLEKRLLYPENEV
jgi:hypothetical protein